MGRRKGDKSIADVEKEVRAYGLLPLGWDSYRAPAPTQVAIDNGLAVIRAIERAGIEDFLYAASVVGGVGITIGARLQGSAYVECRNEGDIWAIYGPQKRVTVKKLTGDLDAAVRSIARTIFRRPPKACLHPTAPTKENRT